MKSIVQITGLLLLWLGLSAGAAFAAPPNPVLYSGRLSDPVGKPLDGPVDLEFRFYQAKTGGGPVNGVPVIEKSGVELNQGVFQVELELSYENLHKVFDGEHEAWIEVKNVTLDKTYPRQRFGLVPFALKIPVDDDTLKFDDTTGKLEVTLPTAGISTSGLLSSGDWNTFNNKQGALGFNPLNKAGDSMGGVLNMGGQKITNLGAPAPTGSSDAVNKAYADTMLGGKSLTVPGTPTNGNVVKWNGSGFVLAADEEGLPGGGINSINGLNDNSQNFQIGTSGDVPNWTDNATDTHYLNIPLASAGATVTAGLISNADYVSFSNKVATGDSRLSDARTPTSHAASHRNGGADEIATATPGANAIPKAGAGSTLALGWLPSALTGKDADTVDGFEGAALEKTANKGANNGYAGLNGSGQLALSTIPSTLTGKDADTVDGFEGAALEKTANKNANNGYAGLNGSAQLALSTIPSTLTGKDADTVDGVEAAAMEKVANKDANNGYAGLDGSGKLSNSVVNWAAPGAIGGTTPAAATFSSLTVADGSQGSGKVFTSDGAGAGTWQALPAIGGSANLGFTGAVAANALTITIHDQTGSALSGSNVGTAIFKDVAAAASARLVSRSITSNLTITIPSTATLGQSDSDIASIYVYLVDDGGTVRVGVTGGLPRDPAIAHSGTQISAAATNRATLYTSGANVTSKAIIYLGKLKAPQTTAGTWAAAPTSAALSTRNELPVGDWCRDLNPAIGATTTAPTKATTRQVDRYTYRRVGGNLELRYEYAATSATGAANGSGYYLWTLPAGLSADTALVHLPTSGAVTNDMVSIGKGWMYNAINVHNGWDPHLYSATQWYMREYNQANNVEYIQGNAANSGQLAIANMRVTHQINLPISGWNP